ncbi:MAG: T9SS type A sorting domain-containing protein [Bacteroidota bacterium]
MQKKVIYPLCFWCLLLWITPLTSWGQVVDTTFKTGTGANNVIREVLLQTDGKILIGGLFTTYNGKTANRIARLNVDGSVDTTFHVGTGANFNVYTLALQSDGKILVGGDFTSFNNVAVRRIVRLHSNGSLDTTFRVTRNIAANYFQMGANGKVFQVESLPNGKIMVSGCFNNFDGSSSTRFARLNANGSVDTTFSTSFSQFGWRIATQSDGKVLISFQNSGKFHRLNADGSIDNTYQVGTGTNGLLLDLIIQKDGKALLAGGFSSFNGSSLRSIGRLNENGSVDSSFKTGISTNGTGSVMRVGLEESGTVLMGGYFTEFNTRAVSTFARIYPNGSLDTTLLIPMTKDFHEVVLGVIAQKDGKILLVIRYQHFGGEADTDRIVRITPTIPPLATPIIIASNSLVFCQGDSVTLSAPAGFAQYKWSNGATSSSIKVKQNGSFTVKVKYASTDFSPASALVTVQVNALPMQPSIMVSRPLVFCQGDSVVLSAPVGQAGYHWSTGAITPSITVKQNGNYTVLVRNGNGCESILSSSVKVQVNPIPVRPVLTVTSPLIFCQGDSVQLSAPSGYAGFRWSTKATTSTIWVKETGSYSLQVISSGGCISAVSIPVSVLVYPVPVQPTISATSALSFCQGDSVVLSLPSGQAGYYWSNGDTTSSITVKKSGRFIAWVTNAEGCESLASAAVNVKVDPLPNRPTIMAASSLEFCQGDSLQLAAPLGYAGYRWSTNATTASIWVKETGNYSLQVISAGCLSPSSLPVSVLVNPQPGQPIISATSALTFCQGDSVVLSAPSGQAHYQWSNGATTSAITVKQTGDFTVRVRSLAGCESAPSPVVQVQVNPLPERPLIVASSLSFCQRDSVILSAPEGQAGYYWSNGAVSPQITVKESNTYWVKVSNSTHCESLPSTVVAITMNPLPILPVITLVGTDTLMVNASAAHYHWKKDGQVLAEENQKIKASQNGTYQVSIDNGVGCHSAISSPYAFFITGVEASSPIGEVLIYPNPAQTYLAWQVPTPYAVLQAHLFDPLGHLCRQWQLITDSTPFSVEGLAPGLYVLQIQIGSSLICKKVIIQP